MGLSALCRLATRLALGLLCAAAAPAVHAKGAYGRVGHQRATGRGGTGPTISRGYTRSYFFMYLGTRHVCSACARNSESDSYGPTMRSAVVVAELDVEFPQDVDLSDGSTARLGAEPLVELRVAAMVIQSVPALSPDDVSVRDSWLAPPSCSGTADTPALACDLDPATDGSAACPAGCDYENSTVMYEVAIFTGELMPNDMDELGQLRSYSRGSLVFEALRLCGDCGALGAASATLGDSRTCAAHEQQVLEWTKLSDCCNATVFAHVANFSEPLAMAGAVRGAQINDCGNRTLEIVTLQSEVETFGDVVLHGEGGRTAESIGLVASFVLLAAWCHCAAQHDARRLGLSGTSRGCGWCDRWDERRRASEAAARRKEITVAPAAPTPAAQQNAAAAGRKDAAPGPSKPARAQVAAKRAGAGAAARAAPAHGSELFSDQADRFIQAAHSGQLADLQALYRRSHVGPALLEAVNGKGGTTALMWAAANGHGDCVRALLDWGAEVNKANSDGNTALHCASKRGELQCVRLLAEGGADQALRNAQGKTALEVARKALASLSPGEQLSKVGGVWSGEDLGTSMSRGLEQAFSPARQGPDVEAGKEVAEPLMAVPVAEPLVPAAEAVAIPGQPLGGDHAQPEPTPAP